MTDVTNILCQIEEGDPSAAEKLLPLLYEELRKLAAARMADERSDHTLQATALVHEAYLRLVGVREAQRWESRGHFFAAASEAMRRILVENARRKRSLKSGGEFARIDLTAMVQEPDNSQIDLIALDEALAELEAAHPEKARIIKLRFFAGLSLEETSDILNQSRATTQREWAYARAWLFGRLNGT